MSNDRHLKPCPFCGATPFLQRMDGIVGISCGKDSACNKTGLAMAFSPEKEETAVAAWNRRAALPSDGVGAPVAPPVAWMIDWPDEPELGHYFGEEPNSSARSVPLFAAPDASAARDHWHDLYTRTMDALAPAFDYIQANADQFRARAC